MVASSVKGLKLCVLDTGITLVRVKGEGGTEKPYIEGLFGTFQKYLERYNDQLETATPQEILKIYIDRIEHNPERSPVTLN